MSSAEVVIDRLGQITEFTQFFIIIIIIIIIITGTTALSEPWPSYLFFYF
jgi:hypothetical protein